MPPRPEDLMDPEIEASIDPADDISYLFDALDLGEEAVSTGVSSEIWCIMFHPDRYHLELQGPETQQLPVPAAHSLPQHPASPPPSTPPLIAPIAIRASQGLRAGLIPVTPAPQPPPSPISIRRLAPLPAPRPSAPATNQGERKYIVFRGFVPGVYDKPGWKAQVVGLPGENVRYKKVRSVHEAEDEFREAMRNGEVAAVGNATSAERAAAMPELLREARRQAEEAFVMGSTQAAPAYAPAPASTQAYGASPRATPPPPYPSAATSRPAPLARDAARDPAPEPATYARWWMVLTGLNPGVYDSWDEATANSSYLRLNTHRRYDTREEAEEAFGIALDTGVVYQQT
ncbi:hypothetical protein BV25DRAFT_1917931 [Artomyces pyxidatus]|uniref:Uncharacterized protein n=1 Tax=Artomyces pyxidatus TaxID=48021 RepID=A0ACB8SWN1_9AGAM|nr:hypothetical protein BV25DRAFT_1917931 [Artomyces pyxidatus]